MSYILDALRKSEQERKLQSGEVPNLSTSHVGKPQKRSLGGYWLSIVLMLLGAGGAIFLLWDRQAPNDVARQVTQHPATDVPAVMTPSPSATRPRIVEPPAKPQMVAPAVPTIQKKPELPSQPIPSSVVKLPEDSVNKPPRAVYPVVSMGGRLAEKLRELAVPEQSDDAAEKPAKQLGERDIPRPMQPEKVAELPPTVPVDRVAEILKEERAKRAEQPVTEPAPVQEVQAQEKTESNPGEPVPEQSALDLYYRTLPAAQNNGVPMTTVSVHVYYDDPAKRFILGGRKRYTEGDSMPNGVTLESITRRGIILEYQGKQYRHDIGWGG